MGSTHQTKDIGSQKHMQKRLIILSLAFLMQACSFPGVFKINVQQGNIITQDMLNSLKPSMTKKQVHFILGKPVIDNVFNQNLENYVYSYQKAGGEIDRQIIKIHYNNNIYLRHEGELLEENPAY